MRPSQTWIRVPAPPSGALGVIPAHLCHTGSGNTESKWVALKTLARSGVMRKPFRVGLGQGQRSAGV